LLKSMRERVSARRAFTHGAQQYSGLGARPRRQLAVLLAAGGALEQGVELTIDWFRRRLASQRAGVGLEASA